MFSADDGTMASQDISSPGGTNSGGPHPGGANLAPIVMAREDHAIDRARHRIEAERAACESKLERLRRDLESLDDERDRARELAEHDMHAKLRYLSELSPELRTPLHAILGYTQLLRMDGGFSTIQTARLDAVLTAGMHLLERIHCVLNLSEAPAENAQDPAPCMEISAGGQDATRPTAPGEAAASCRQRVLVVDDMAMNRDIASAFLRSAGHEVTLVGNGLEAVCAATTLDFDVVLMDLRMPGIDGFEATRRIRALDGPRGRVPIVALSALAFIEKIEDCKKAGMNGHLAKPFSPDTLLGAINRAAGNAATRDDPAAPHFAQPAPPLVSLARFKHIAASARAGDENTAARLFAGQNGQDADATEQVIPAQQWIDIISPWNRAPSAVESMAYHRPRLTFEGREFVLRMASVMSTRGHRLVDSKLACEPPPAHENHEFHWLLFVAPEANHHSGFSASCDLWRWSLSIWRSITVPGAHFSPEEMHDQGWRYCGPCADQVARVEVFSDGGRPAS